MLSLNIIIKERNWYEELWFNENVLNKNLDWFGMKVLIRKQNFIICYFLEILIFFLILVFNIDKRFIEQRVSWFFVVFVIQEVY